jgi:Galactose oxidase, central domain/Kelch motif
MSTPRVGGAAVAMPGGDVLVAGGSSGDGGEAARRRVIDLGGVQRTGATNTMASSRLLPAVALLPDGDVLVVGGQDQSGNSLSSADLYDPTTNTFLTGSQAPPNMSTGRALPLVATLDNGHVLVAGGAGANNVPLASAEVYNPTMNSWSATANSMSVLRLAGGIAPLADGRELLVGGASADQPNAVTTATTDFYSPSANSFTSGPSMASPRLLFGIAALQDGRILVAGGVNEQGTSVDAISAAEIFDPSTGQWSPTGSLRESLAEFATAVLPSGQVVEAGGSTSGLATDATTQASLYSPATAPTAPLAVSASPGNGSALVTFAPPASDDGSPITGYMITASTGQTATTPDARTFATVTGVANGAPVTFTVRALDGEGAGAASSPSNAVTPTATTAGTASTPDTPATVRISGLPRRLSLRQFLKGVRFAVTPSKQASLEVMLAGTASQATIADAFDLTLAHRTLGLSAAKRTITLHPSKKLIGHPAHARVEPIVVAADATGSRSTTTQSIVIHN